MNVIARHWRSQRASPKQSIKMFKLYNRLLHTPTQACLKVRNDDKTKKHTHEKVFYNYHLLFNTTSLLTSKYY